MTKDLAGTMFWEVRCISLIIKLTSLIVNVSWPWIGTTQTRWSPPLLTGLTLWSSPRCAIGRSAGAITYHHVHGQKHLSYPRSKWDNLRNGMPNNLGYTYTSDSGKSGSANGSGSSQCKGIAPWNPTVRD